MMPKKKNPVGRPKGTLKENAVRRQPKISVYASSEAQRERWHAAARVAGQSLQQLGATLLDRYADECGV